MQILTENRKARFDYEIIDTYQAGIELEGHEVKSVKSGKAGLTGSYAIIRGNEAWLLNAHIPAYQPKNTAKEYDPARTRRLLLHKKEIANLSGKLHEKGISLIPMKLYALKGFVKVELGLGKARKAHDKREVLKKRAVAREMERG
jgi:SsrA-binding protein